jgi:hypothetical protein
MANIKISELTALTPPAAADELVVVDVSATSTKKTTVGEVVGIITGDVEVANNGTATISELPVSKLQDGAARQLLQTDAAGTGVEWASNIDVPGTLDVTGAATFDANVTLIGAGSRLGINTTSPSSKLSITTAANSPALDITDASTSDFIITPGVSSGVCRVGPATGAMALYTGNSERARIDSSGRLLIGASSDSGGALLQVNGNRIRIATAKTPSSAADTGTAGEICWDANYIYVCTATDTWKRTAISTW